MTLLLILILQAKAQRDLTFPEASQKAGVSQRIGLTDISIVYHSPLVNNRKVWDGLVPYNEVWRAGANENTTICFSTDVSVDGKKLPAGTYGLHMIPTPGKWTVIFSKDYKSWGSFFYDEKQDALRIVVSPQETAMQNWLSYSFIQPEANSVKARMHWEKIAVDFTITVDVAETVFQNMREELKTIPGFFPAAYQQAADYCIRNKMHLEEASAWIDKSISLQKNFANLNTKSQLMELQGKTVEATALKKEALGMADETQLNAYGYELLGRNKFEEAITVFKENVKKYPGSWNVYDSLAEAYEKSGQSKPALDNYKIALKKAPVAQQERLNKTIARLEKG